jgi:hypothetical protein
MSLALAILDRAALRSEPLTKSTTAAERHMNGASGSIISVFADIANLNSGDMKTDLYQSFLPAPLDGACHSCLELDLR